MSEAFEIHAQKPSAASSPIPAPGAGPPAEDAIQVLVRKRFAAPDYQPPMLPALRHVVLESAFHARVVRGTPFDGVLSLAQTHSLGVAYLCRMVARSLDADADFAFMLGLLHEAGLIAALTVLSEERDQPLNPDVIRSVGALHTSAGGFIAARWKLPEPLRDAIASHHQPPTAEGPAVLALSEHLGEVLGLGMPGFDDGDKAARTAAALKLFAIDEKGLEKLLGDGRKIVELAIRE